MPPEYASVMTPTQVRARLVSRVVLWVVVALTTIPGFPAEWPAFVIALGGAGAFWLAALLRGGGPLSNGLGGAFSIAVAAGVVGFTGALQSPYAVLFLVVLVDDAVAHQLKRLLIDGALAVLAWLVMVAAADIAVTDANVRFTALHGLGWFMVLAITYQVTGQLRQVAAMLRDSNVRVARSEQRFRSLFDNHPDGVHVRGRDGQLLAANPAIRELLGIHETAGDSRSMHSELVPTEFQPLFQQRLERAFDGTAQTFRARMRRMDGSEFPVLRTYIPITVDGDVVGVFAVSQDITAQVEGERARARLASIVEHADMAIMSLAGEIVTSWNAASQRLFGWTSDEIIGRSVRLAVPEDRYDELDEFHRCVRRGEALSVDTVRLRKDGRRVDVNVTVSPVRNRAGKVVAASAIVRDISKRKAAERALRASEERFRLLAEQAEGVVYRLRLEPEPGFEFVNASAAEVTGFSADEFYADPSILRQRTHPDDLAQLRRRLNGGDLGGAVTFRFRRPDGTWTWLEDHYRILDNGGRRRAIQGIVFDVAAREESKRRLERALEQEQAAADQLREASEMQAAFLRAVSHELRTPLTSVLGFAHTLHKHAGELPPHQVERLLGRLVGGANRLRSLLDDLLDLNRLSRQAIVLDPRPQSLAAVCERALSDVDVGGHPLAVDLQPVQVSVDAGTVERIVDNLVRNAVRHTPRGTRIWVATAPTPEGGGAVIVEDDGPGVPDRYKEAIFDPFRQGPDALGDARPGTGIGLNLVRQFAQLHGGRAWVEDRRGGGARFVVTFPAEPPLTAETRTGRPPRDIWSDVSS